MGRKIAAGIGGLLLVAVLYLLLWPVPADEPVAWEPPPDPGHTGRFSPNELLADPERLALGGLHGPEDVAIGEDGRIYVPTEQGWIVRYERWGAEPERWADTKGRPLGIELDAHGNLIVADAYEGLLSISPDGEVTTLARRADTKPIRYADDVDVAPDGRIYLSDASTKFGAESIGDTMQASVYELLEHRGTGRVIAHNRNTGETSTLVDGLVFANGITVSEDGRFLLVNETGNYRVLRVWLRGKKRGETEVLIEGLPGFPDNASTGLEGRFWVALVSPRRDSVDALAPYPFARTIVQRLPKFLQPAPASYGHVIAVDRQGQVAANLQDPAGGYPQLTGAVETREHLYLGSLVADAVARVPKSRLEL